MPPQSLTDFAHYGLIDWLVVAMVLAVALYVALEVIERVRLLRRHAALVRKASIANPPIGPYPLRSFQQPAAKGFARHTHSAVVAEIEAQSIRQLAAEQRSRFVHRAARSITDSHPDHRYGLSAEDQAFLTSIEQVDGPEAA